MAAQTAAASSWFGRKRRLIAVRDRLAPYLRPGATVKPKDVPALVEALWRVQTAVQAIAARADSIPGLSVPPDWNPFLDADLLERQVQWLRRAGAAVDGVVALPRGAAQADRRRAARPARPRPSPGCGTPLTALVTVCRSSADQLATWAGDDGFVLRWSMTRPERGRRTTWC